MAQTQMFNSPFEMGLRILLLLSTTSRQPYSVDRIVGLDLIACYAADFDLPYPNLHGMNNYKYGEIVSRRLLVQEAVKDLVTTGMIDVTVDRGYLFSASEAGIKYARKLKSDYAADYKEIAKAVAKKYKNNTDEGILATIQEHSVQAIRG